MPTAPHSQHKHPFPVWLNPFQPQQSPCCPTEDKNRRSAWPQGTGMVFPWLWPGQNSSPSVGNACRASCPHSWCGAQQQGRLRAASRAVFASTTSKSIHRAVCTKTSLCLLSWLLLSSALASELPSQQTLFSTLLFSTIHSLPS